MSYGYSQRLVEANNTADPKSRGVYLGSRCIKLGISVSEVAEAIGVSRATVYNWFTGKATPRAHQQEKIRKALARWQRRA
jgi:transcriptional regulator with XRE-family HTH domain